MKLESFASRHRRSSARHRLLWPPPTQVTAPEPKAESGVGRLLASAAFVGVFGAIGLFAPIEFVQHFSVFVLSCFVGWQLIWNVNHALHTPLMSVTNAISGIILVGGLLQTGRGESFTALPVILAAVALLLASINVVGGFLVTHRMLAMFRRGN